MSEWLDGIRKSIEKEVYGPTEKYQIMVQIGNTWTNAAVLSVKSEYAEQEEAEKQGRILSEVDLVKQVMIAKKTTVCFSDLETKQTTRATEWSCLLLV